MVFGITLLCIGLFLDRKRPYFDTTKEGWVLLWYYSSNKERKYIKLWKKDVH